MEAEQERKEMEQKRAQQIANSKARMESMKKQREEQAKKIVYNEKLKRPTWWPRRQRELVDKKMPPVVWRWA